MQERSYERGSCVQKNCAILGGHPNNFGPIQEGDWATFSAVSDTRCSTYLIFTAFLTAERIKDLNALSDVAYKNFGAIFSSCTQSCTQTSPPIFRLRTPSEREGAESSEGRIVLTGKSSDRFLFPTEKRLSLLSLRTSGCGGLLQIIMVKRGSHSFPVRLPDSQLAGVFVPTRDHLPHLADNRPRALRG